MIALLVVAAWPQGAGAAKYTVAQCGWGVGVDAEWSENATRRYASNSVCAPGGSDVWTGVRLRTYTLAGARSAAATTLGRWRWFAPPGTDITKVEGAWWHELRNGFQHRLGGMREGSFQRARTAKASSGMGPFVAGFNPGVETFESRLLCARAYSRRCDTGPSSQAMVRALTITLEDGSSPSVSVDGSVLGSGWLTGEARLSYDDGDEGSGLKWAETLVDGSRLRLSQFPCEQELVGGEWRGERMQPCGLEKSGSHAVDTTELTDGEHTIRHCAEDFAGNRECGSSRSFKVDNSAPAAPQALELPGDGDWLTEPGIDLAWSNPSQGRGSGIARASYRVTGPDGYDSGVGNRDGDGIEAIEAIELPSPGAYTVEVWLRDAAGNERRSNSAESVYRFDDQPPEIGFRGFNDASLPEQLRARVADAHSGPAEGSIQFRRADTEEWNELATRMEETGAPGEVDLIARLPSDHLEPAVYEFRAEASDRAGNPAETTRRLDGTEMSVATPVKAATRVTASLEAEARSGRMITVGFGAEPALSGRLMREGGAPISDRELRLVVTPADGARGRPSLQTVETGPDGEFRLDLEPSTSRRIEVRFPGGDELAASRAPDLDLEVRSSLTMRTTRRAVRTGQVLGIEGELNPRDAWIPPQGKLIAIQYLETRARRWRPVAFARTDSSGEYRTQYRFRYTTRPSRVRLRAVAMSEARWPYAAGASAAVAVRVFPRRWRARRAQRVRRARRVRQARRARRVRQARRQRARARRAQARARNRQHAGRR